MFPSLPRVATSHRHTHASWGKWGRNNLRGEGEREEEKGGGREVERRREGERVDGMGRLPQATGVRK